MEKFCEVVTFNFKHNNKRDKSYKVLGSGWGKESIMFYEEGPLCSRKKE